MLEHEIAKQGGLDPPLERTQPAPHAASAARQEYESTAKEFDQLLIRIRSYLGQDDIEIQVSIYSLFDEAKTLAVKIKQRAEHLADFPHIFIQNKGGILRFSKLAEAAPEAYQRRLDELEQLEAEFGSKSHPRRMRTVTGTLLSHEDYKGGHILEKHVGLSMEDFKQRIQGEGKTVVSSFFDWATAEEVLSRAIEINLSRFEQAKEGERIQILFDEIRPIGYLKMKGIPPFLVSSGELIAYKDSRSPSRSGYRLLTIKLYTRKKKQL